MDIPFELDPEQKQIKQKIFPYLKALIYELAIKQPINIEKYMIDFLTKYGNYTASGLTIEEKKELESLRIAVKHYRNMEKHDLVKSNSDFNKNNVIKDGKADAESSESEEDVMDEKEEAEINSKLNNIQKKQVLEKAIKSRSSVSAEVYGFYNKKEKFVPKVIPKNDEQMNRIKGKIISSFIFSSLEKKDLDIVINAMEEKRFKLDDKVISQGEDGDCLYIVETGNLKCFKTFNSDNTPKLLKIYEPGDSFGELALLYNCPRAATIICSSEESILWSLDRETFNHIVKEAAQKKREKYENFLKNVDILSTIDSYELGQICDSLKDGYYKKDDYIIREGELGDVFYILEEGTCNATKTLEPGKPETVIKELKEGDYFGERALLKGEPRYANIIVTSETAKVISLDRLSFNRLLGPILEILKRNIDKYQVYCITNNDTIENKENNMNDKNTIEIENKENNNVDDNVNNQNNNNKENNNNIDDNTNNKNENENENENNKDAEGNNKLQNLYSVNDILTPNNNENSTSEIQIPVLNIPVSASDNNPINDEKNEKDEKENEKNDNKEGEDNNNEDKDNNYNNIDPNKDLNSIITGNNEQIINNANEENANDKKEEPKDYNDNAENGDKKIEENNIDNQNEKENEKIEENNIDNQNEKEADKSDNNNENNNNLESLQDMIASNKKNNEDSVNNNEDVGYDKNENSPAIKFSESVDSSENNINNKGENKNQNGNENNMEENPNNEKPLQPLSDMIAPNEE